MPRHLFRLRRAGWLSRVVRHRSTLAGQCGARAPEHRPNSVECTCHNWEMYFRGIFYVCAAFPVSALMGVQRFPPSYGEEGEAEFARDHRTSYYLRRQVRQPVLSCLDPFRLFTFPAFGMVFYFFYWTSAWKKTFGILAHGRAWTRGAQWRHWV